MKKRILLPLVLALALICLTCIGCASQEQPAPPPEQPTETEQPPVEAPVETVTLKMATKMPEDSIEGLGFQRFADLVNEYTNGEIFVQIYPNEQLGDTTTCINNLALGIIDLYIEGSTYYNGYSDKFDYIVVPFYVPSWEAYVELVQGEWGEKQAADMEAAGFKILSTNRNWARGPYYAFCTTFPVTKYEDVVGARVRTHDNAVFMDAMNRLGMNPLVIAYSEVYMALQQSTVSGTWAPISNVESMGFYEVAPYVTKMDTYNQELPLVMNKARFDSFTPEQQEALIRAANEAADYNNSILEDAVAESMARMEAEGAIIYLDFDITPMREVLEEDGFYEECLENGIIPQEVAEFFANY